MIAPMLGMKARTPVTNPKQARHWNAGDPQHEPGEYALEDHGDEAAEQEPSQREADMLGDPVEARAMPERQHPGDAAIVKAWLGREEDADHQHRDHARDAADDASDGARQVADAAQELCRQSVGLPTTRPSEETKAINRSNCAVTTSRSASNCAAMVVPANQKTQPRKPKPRIRTRARRHAASDREDSGRGPERRRRATRRKSLRR